MEKRDILWIGVGECGGRIVNEILSKDRRYVGMFINTNYDDFKGLENVKDNVFTMANSSGTGKNRAKSKVLFNEHRHSIVEEILKYGSQKILHFVFGMGGGSGGGAVPSLIYGLKMMDITKPINVTCVLPSFKDNKRYRKNAIECWQELSQLDNIYTMHVLDNGKRQNKGDINKEYAEMFDIFMNMPKFIPAEDSKVDPEEIGIIGLCKGSTVIYNLPNDEKNVKIGMAKATQDSIFADLCDETEKCEYLAITTKPNGYNQKDIENEFDVNEYAINSFNDEHNLIVASGFKPQKVAVETLERSIIEEEKNRNSKDDVFSDLKIKTEIETKQSSNLTPTNQKHKDVDAKAINKLLDDDDLWSKAFDM